MAGGRTIGRHLRHRRNAPVEATAGHRAPLAVGEGDLHHAGAVGCHLDLGVGLGDVGEIVAVGPAFDTREHHFRAGVLVIHAQQRARALLIEGKEPNEVVVVAEAPGLVGGRQGARVEGSEAIDERVAPADQDIGVVAFGNMMGFVDTVGQLAEHKSGGRGPCRTGSRSQGGGAEQRSCSRDPQRALEPWPGRSDVGWVKRSADPTPLVPSPWCWVIAAARPNLQCGDKLWIVEACPGPRSGMVAPFGGTDEMLKDLKAEIILIRGGSHRNSAIHRIPVVLAKSKTPNVT